MPVLCPSCKKSVPGGQSCPTCHRAIPERETFSGQGGHYLAIMILIAAGMTIFFVILDRWSSLQWAHSVEWHWIAPLLVIQPIAIGLYYWTILRNEEITITDDYIYRRSHWGNEKIRWHDLIDVKELSVLPRDTAIGRVSWFSRFFSRKARTSYSPYTRYELVAKEPSGRITRLCIETSTIDDVDWLLELVHYKQTENDIALEDF